jgi:hypothetical protein
MNIVIVTEKYTVLLMASLVTTFTAFSIAGSRIDIFASATSNVTSFMLNWSHTTDRPAYISLANISDQQQPVGEIKPLITSGENLSNSYSFPGIQDGLGAVEVEDGSIDVYVNHEYDSEGLLSIPYTFSLKPFNSNVMNDIV